MELRLIALPWADARSPQPALGALLSYVKQQAPTWQVEADYAYLDVSAIDPALYEAVATSDIEGERLYATLMYPAGTEALVEYWGRLTERTRLGVYVLECKRRGQRIADVVAALRERLDAHLSALVAARSWDGVVVGLTTTFSQLFANLLLAQRIKARAPSATIILGGSTVSPAKIADSLLRTYPFVDFIVRGEGELPLLSLLQQIEQAQAQGESGGAIRETPRGVASREQPAAGGGLWQVADLDALPVPDYDSYYQRVRHNGRGNLPIEGSRGCWWDRTTKNPKATCNFCNLNVQWDGFRQKSARRVLHELRTLAERYQGTYFTFLDNIVRLRDFDAFIAALSELGMDAHIFHEARANLRPIDILRFYEVGLRSVQFGLEGLSGSFLKRINKGTSVIMNLEAMKTCTELGIRSSSNLIVGFPGSTDAEVRETLEVIDRYAFAYEPPHIAGFELGIDSVVARYPAEFGLANLRNEDRYAAILPADTLATLQLFQLSFDWLQPPADWWPVMHRVERWQAESGQSQLFYQDGGSFLYVFRKRAGHKIETMKLEAEPAQIYRLCLQITTRSELDALLGNAGPEAQAQRDATLQKMVERDLLYQDGSRYLALAMALDPFTAARRIRTRAALQPAVPVQPAPPRKHLSVLP